MGEDSADQTPDVVIFFDANMPDMERCRGDCSSSDLLCVHRFNFTAHPVWCRKAIKGLDDFRVLEYFFNFITRHNNWQTGRKPLFVLVTKDHKFLERGVPEAYKKALKAQKTKLTLKFNESSVLSDESIILIKVIDCDNYGTDRRDNLRCTIKLLNEMWNGFAF